jgi:hypothetical protein
MENAYKQIQSAVDNILNVSTIVRRKKKTESDKKRELFFQIITAIEEIQVRQNIMYLDLKLDFANYDEKFLAVVDALLYMHFGHELAEIISFYIWERVTPDGSVNALLAEDGTEIVLNNPYDLWTLLCTMNPKLVE